MNKKKNKKPNSGAFLKNARETAFKWILNIAVIAIFLTVVGLLAKAYLYRSDYFRLNKVDIKETFLDQRSLLSIRSRILNSYRGKSVFGLNLKGIAQALQNSYPDAKDISVTLALPDKLVVGLKLRRPVALIRADKLYPVDEEGVMLPAAAEGLLKSIPSVDGVQITPVDRKTKTVASRNLKKAIEVLRDINDIRSIANYGIETVDVRDINNISFSLRNGIEVRIGAENFKDRLIVLAKTLRDPRMIMDRIKYIDLRFGDAVIGPK